MPAVPDQPRSGASIRCSGPFGGRRQGFARYREQADPDRHACFPIVQGSMYADLRRDCAQALVELDAPGYAIGGLSVGEPRALSQEMVEVAAPLLPLDKPRYVMGVGMPAELPEYVARGVDMMDCVLPSRNARNGYLFTSAGQGDHQAESLSRRPAAARSGLLLLHLLARTRARTCGTCFRPARFCTRRWPQYTT